MTSFESDILFILDQLENLKKDHPEEIEDMNLKTKLNNIISDIEFEFT